MEYEKKYKEALESLKGLLEGVSEGNYPITKDDIIEIFPELEESEDEKIRKVLIELVKCNEKSGYKLLNNVPTSSIVAWLEKQKEFVSADFDDVWDTADCDELTAPLEKYSKDAIKKMCHAWYDKGIELERRNWLEKHGEQNDSDVKDYSSIDPHFGKHIDKVGPKFKAGDWIVRELDNSVHQVKAVIENISNGKYGYDLTKGGYVSSQDANFYHLWTIEDAKDGDVLQLGKVTAIFQDYISDKECRCYCSVFEGEFKIPIQYADTYGCHNVIPATKEQCEQLEKAMADAGYTFDFYKKELKKIKDEIEIPFGAKDSELIEESYYIPKGFYAEIDDDKVVIKKGEKPTAWSEEDENIKQWIISDIDKLFCLNKKSSSLVGKEIEWLKSLKERVQPQSKQEWSEEDMSKIQRICQYLDEAKKYYADITEVRECIDWLKSLRFQSTWKSSDE